MSRSSDGAEYSTDLWLERSLFAGLHLGNISYGLHAALFGTTLYFMHAAKKTRKMPFWLFIYVWVMFGLGTIQVAGNAKFYERMWIDERDIPGGPSSFLTTHFDDAFNTLATSGYIAAIFLQDSMLLYRLLVIWNFWYPIAVVPVLAFITSTTFSILTTVQSSKPGSGPWNHTSVVFAIPFCALSVGFNMAMTLAIAGRMLLIRKRVVSAIGEQHAKLYTSIAAMFIESGAVYSVVGLIFIISYGRQSNVQNLVFPSLEQAICIASELIMLRIALGRAWTAEVSAQASSDPNLTPTEKQSIRFHVPTDISTRSQVMSTNDANRNPTILSTFHADSASISESDVYLEEGKRGGDVKAEAI